MSRVNITVPDDVAARARVAGLNVSRVATAALVEELDRRSKVEELDRYLAELESELGPISPAERTNAKEWVDQLLSDTTKSSVTKRRRSA